MERLSLPSLPWPPSSLLARLSPDTRDAMLALGVARHYRCGQVLIREGDRTTHAVLLRTGFVKVTAVADSGRNTLLAIRTRGDLVGELGAIERVPRAATVTAPIDVVGNEIRCNELIGFLRRHPNASLAVTGMVGNRLRMANRRRLDFAGVTAKARVSRILVELGEQFGEISSQARGFNLAITQRELAELAGVTQVSVQRALRALRAQGLLTTGYGRIDVTRTDALRVQGRLLTQTDSII